MRQQLPSQADEPSPGIHICVLKSSILCIFLVTERGGCCTTEELSIYGSPCFNELQPYSDNQSITATRKRSVVLNLSAVHHDYS